MVTTGEGGEIVTIRSLSDRDRTGLGSSSSPTRRRRSVTSSSVSSSASNRSRSGSSSGNSSSGTVPGSGNSSSNEEEQWQQQYDGASISFPSHQTVPPQGAIEAGAATAATVAPGAVPLTAVGGVRHAVVHSSPARASRARAGMAVVGEERKERDQEQEQQEHQEQLRKVVGEQLQQQEQQRGGDRKDGVTASPVRRSQTQAAMLADGGGKGGEGGEEGGAEDASSVILPHAPRVGPMYQVPDNNLRVCQPLFPATAGFAAAAAASAVATCSRVGEVARKGLIWSPHDVEEERAQALMEGLKQMHGSSSISSSSSGSSSGNSSSSSSSSSSGRGPERGMERRKVGDEGVEVGWVVLRATGSVAKAMAAAVDCSGRAMWNKEEEATFLEGMNEYDKNFRKIQALLPGRTLKEVISYFYLWKQGPSYREWKANRPLQYVEQAIPDYHADVCDMCERPGDLLCCDTCNLAFHMQCLGLDDQDDVPEDFSCSQCLEQYRADQERDRAKRWVETQVKKVQVLREKELQKLEGAPAGYIGRRRTKASQSKRGQKRKREDCNSHSSPSATGAGNSPSSGPINGNSSSSSSSNNNNNNNNNNTTISSPANPLLPVSASFFSSSSFSSSSSSSSPPSSPNLTKHVGPPIATTTTTAAAAPVGTVGAGAGTGRRTVAGRSSGAVEMDENKERPLLSPPSTRSSSGKIIVGESLCSLGGQGREFSLPPSSSSSTPPSSFTSSSSSFVPSSSSKAPNSGTPSAAAVPQRRSGVPRAAAAK